MVYARILIVKDTARFDGGGTFDCYSFPQVSLLEFWWLQPRFTFISRNGSKLNCYRWPISANRNADFVKESKWLSQLISLRPNSDDYLYRWALAVNHSAKEFSDIDGARQALSRALASMNGSADLTRSAELRRMLIERLLELKGVWYSGAERQVLLSSATNEDPIVLRQLALSLYGQLEAGEWRPRESKSLDQEKDYWPWLASQPVGVVVEKAHEWNGTLLI